MEWSLYLKRGDSATTNLVKLYFLSISSAVILLGFLVNFYEKYLPGFISKTFRWGKFAYKGSTTFPIIEFPKSSFKQFYELGVVCMGVTYVFMIYTYILGFELPILFTDVVNTLAGNRYDRFSKISATRVFIASTLLTLQIVRRYYDTHFVSIFGKSSKIGLTHWGVGITFYPMVILAIISEAPNFSTRELQMAKWSEVGITDGLGILLFMWAWKHQHVCTVILANLRKTEKGIVNDYKLPVGDWFKYVSSPHCSAEILMYLSLTVFLWQNTTWWYVILWILGNQIESILLSHWWYKDNFKNFPKNRKALLPHIY